MPKTSRKVTFKTIGGKKLSKFDLNNLGLTDEFLQKSIEYNNLYIGRVSSQYKNSYQVITEAGDLIAEVPGKFHYNLKQLSEYPSVGDFVMVDRTDNACGNGIIHHVLPRKSLFSRKVAGSTNEIQVVASNIDTVFICMSLNNDFNLRRLERYLSIAWDSGGVPVIVLTKSDLCEEIDERFAEVSSIAMGVDVLVTTSTFENGYQSLHRYLAKGQTVAFIGSSGVGKSTLINRLLGHQALNTNAIRNDDKGKHTTTRRDLIIIPDSGVVIDTPGMREIGVINTDLSKSFADIDELASNCRFNDCSHTSEPNCAVQSAIQDGHLLSDRLESYRKLKKETKYDGMNARMIEREKANTMFESVGGMKHARKFIKQHNKRKK